MPKLENPQIPAERDHIDRKQHAKRMNSGRRPDKQPASGVEPSPARQTYQAGERRIGDCDPCADRGGPRYVSEVHCVVFTSPSSPVTVSKASHGQSSYTFACFLRYITNASTATARMPATIRTIVVVSIGCFLLSSHLL